MLQNVERANREEVRQMTTKLDIFSMASFTKAQYIEYWTQRKPYPQQAQMEWEYDRKQGNIKRIATGMWRYVK